MRPSAHPELMHALRSAEWNAGAWRQAIAKARPVLATDQDVQLQVGSMLISAGNPVDGLAWELLACMWTFAVATSANR